MASKSKTLTSEVPTQNSAKKSVAVLASADPPADDDIDSVVDTRELESEDTKADVSASRREIKARLSMRQQRLSQQEDDFDFMHMDDDLKALMLEGVAKMEQAELTKLDNEGEEIENYENELEGDEEMVESEQLSRDPSTDDFEEYMKAKKPFTACYSDTEDLDYQNRSQTRKHFSIKKDKFEKLTDPGLALALMPKPPPTVIEFKGLKKIKEDYKAFCKDFKKRPCREFLDNIKSAEMDLSYCALNGKSVAIICRSLKTNPYVKKLNLRGNPAGYAGAKGITEMLIENTAIMELDLTATEILHGFDEICEALEFNETVKVLHLSHNELGNQEMKFLVRTLTENDQITYLNLSRNWISDLGARYLGQGLAANLALLTLDLSFNRICGGKSSFPLFDGIANHPTLETIDFNGNSIKDLASQKIAQIVIKNPTLKFMNVAYNRIGDKVCIPLANALARSPAMVDFIAGPNLWREKTTVRMILPFANRNLASPLERLYLDENMYVTKHFLKAEKRVANVRPDLKIVRGDSYGLRKKQPERLRTVGIRRLNIVCQNFETPLEMLIDELRTEPGKMTEKQFKKFIKSCNLYKDKSMTEAIMKHFATTDKFPNEIDCEAIIAEYDLVFGKPKPESLAVKDEEERKDTPGSVTLVDNQEDQFCLRNPEDKKCVPSVVASKQSVPKIKSVLLKQLRSVEKLQNLFVRPQAARPQAIL